MLCADATQSLKVLRTLQPSIPTSLSGYSSRHSRFLLRGDHRFSGHLQKLTAPAKERLQSVQAEASQKTAEPLRFGKGSIQELPIFPLSVVAFPTADTPLNIFEARYRVLFNTLLSGSDGIVEDLVNPDKPWVGTKLFGMCYLTNDGQMANVGTTLWIYKHVCTDDGRMVIANRGVEKFKVLKVIQQNPIMICQVEILEDDEDAGEEVVTLAKEAMDTFVQFVQLNIRVKQLKTSTDLRIDMDDKSPREVSYWLASIFAQNPYAQQALLEETTVKGRLTQEKDVLEGITKVLRAQAAVQSALAPEEEPSEGTKPTAEAEDKSEGDQDNKSK